MSGRPNFSPYPFGALRRVSRRDAAIESAIARWVAARPRGGGPHTAALVGGPVRARVVGLGGECRVPPDAAVAELRLGGLAIAVAASGAAVRALAQRLLGGPDELAAPRAPTTV